MIMKKVIVVLIALCMMLSSSVAFGAYDDELDVIGDALLLRPFGLAALVVGSVAYVVTLPIAAITKSVDTTTDVMVRKPYEYTFKRPIGDL